MGRAGPWPVVLHPRRGPAGPAVSVEGQSCWGAVVRPARGAGSGAGREAPGSTGHGSPVALPRGRGGALGTGSTPRANRSTRSPAAGQEEMENTLQSETRFRRRECEQMHSPSPLGAATGHHGPPRATTGRHGPPRAPRPASATRCSAEDLRPGSDPGGWRNSKRLHGASLRPEPRWLCRVRTPRAGRSGGRPQPGVLSHSLSRKRHSPPLCGPLPTGRLRPGPPDPRSVHVARAGWPLRT